MTVAFEQIAEQARALHGLRAADVVERYVAVALQAAGDVPIGQAVADVIEAHESWRGTLIP